MCGILFIFGLEGDERSVRKLACSLTRRQRHRGPDQSGFHMFVIANIYIFILLYIKLILLSYHIVHII
jgi:asparagine synthetase B (glutamine-hydrolysing)